MRHEEDVYHVLSWRLWSAFLTLTQLIQLHMYFTPVTCVFYSSYMCILIQLHVYLTPVTCVFYSSYMCILLQLHVYFTPVTCVFYSSYMCILLQLHVYLTPVTCVFYSSYMCILLQLHVYFTPVTREHTFLICTLYPLSTKWRTYKYIRSSLRYWVLFQKREMLW